MTRKQRKNEDIAQFLDRVVGPNESSRKIRADNKRVEKRKRSQFRKNRD